MPNAVTKEYLTRRQLRERYKCVDRTIARWVNDPKLGFPRPIVIRERQFFDRAEVEAFSYAYRRFAPNVGSAS